MRLPPTVILVQFSSAFCGQMVQRKWAHVVVLHLGALVILMKWVVLVPSTRFLTPWARRPNLLAEVGIYHALCVFGFLINSLHSMDFPVSGLMTALVSWSWMFA